VLLVVDDEEPPCTVTARMLALAGYTVLTAASGVEALRILDTEKPGSIRLVITDIKMPTMDGTELARRIHERPLPPRILFMTGAVSPRTTKTLPGPLLEKPFSPSELFRRVQELLHA
jgi:CheY-like chemotaxis protein